MNKKQFIELTGENPEDVLGNDWKNEADDYLEIVGATHEGHAVGECYICKDGI